MSGRNLDQQSAFLHTSILQVKSSGHHISTENEERLCVEWTQVNSQHFRTKLLEEPRKVGITSSQKVGSAYVLTELRSAVNIPAHKYFTIEE